MLRVAYLINQYPKVSHSFIRREILALERQGNAVLRIAMRGWDEVLPDPVDATERTRTRYLLEHGLVPLLGSAARIALTRPTRFFCGMRLACAMWRRSDRKLFHHLAYLVEACALVEWLAAARIGHLHAHFGTNPAEVAMLARVLGGPPYSFTVHGPEEFDKPEALGLSEKGQHAAFVVAISSFGRSQLYRWLPQSHWHKVQVVHCGLEAAFHEGVTNDGAGAAGPQRLVCVGRLCEQKGQLLLVQALQRVIERGVAVDLVLAGDGEMRGQIEALVEQLGLRAHVRITGWIGSAQVRDEILAARALVLPSFAEGLPVVIMEAMALRRPVITTFVAGIPELVVDGETGWLVPAGDVVSLAQAMKACLAAGPNQLARMGAAANLRVLERHDIDREAAKLAALCAGVGGDAAAGASLSVCDAANVSATGSP
ncbi:MAG: glycosyltransferase family 4 protein [Ramlibacter sp.]|nr:glycosyltransferase family 4 protein [Ramlibacter sp.]